MRTRAIASILATTIAATSPVSFSSVARAQGNDAADINEARALFDQGKKLFKDGKYEEARVKFKAALGLKRRPSILINLGLAELQTRRPLDAAGHFREVLAMTEAKPDDREDAKSGLADAHKMLGVIVVDAPHGSSVSIDGDAPASASMADGVEVLPGGHTVVIKAADGRQMIEKVTVVAGQSVTVRHKGSAATIAEPTAPAAGAATGATSATTMPTAASGAAANAPPPAAVEDTPPPLGEPPRKDTDTSRSGIHPVTWVTAGATIVSAGLWITFYALEQHHTNRAQAYLDYINAHPGSSNLAKYRADGIAEADSANADKTLAIVFGVSTGVFAVATVVTYFALKPKRSSETSVSWVAAPIWGGAAFGVVGAF